MVKTRCSHILESKIKHIFDRVSFLSLYCLISPSVFRTGNIKGKRRIWNLSEASFFLFPLSNQPPSFHIPNSLSLCKKPFFSTEGERGKGRIRRLKQWRVPRKVSMEVPSKHFAFLARPRIGLHLQKNHFFQFLVNFTP